MGISQQTRPDAPPVASSHAKTHGQLKELHIPSWATARPCLRPLTSLCILGSELVVHHFCQLEVDALPLGMPAINNVARQTRLSWLCLPCELWLTPHRSASLASDAYVTHAIPAREATKPQGSTRHRTGSGGTGSPHFLLDVTSSPSRHERYYECTYNRSLVIRNQPLGKNEKGQGPKKKFSGYSPYIDT